MKRALLIWAAMACMAVHSVPAQDATVNKIIEIGQTDNQVMDHLDVLTNRIGGRTHTTMQSIGCLPSLRNGDWKLNCKRPVRYRSASTGGRGSASY